MLRVLVFLILIAIGATGAVWLADNPGDVVVTWQGYRAETSLVVALLVVIALTGTIGLIWSLIRGIFRLPGLLALASRNRRRAKGFTSVTRGMVAVGSGDANAARRHASEAEKMLGGAPLVLLLKAQTAQMSGDRKGAESAFKSMIEESETRVLGLRGLHIEAKRRNDDLAALSYAKEAARLAPGAAWASEAVLNDQCARADWAGARTTLERRAAMRMVDKAEAKLARAALLTAEAEARVDAEPAAALALAKEALSLKPGLAPAAALAGRQLAQKGDLRRASRLMEAAWKVAPHPDIAEVYLNVRHGDTTRDRLDRARTLHKMARTNDEARLVLMQAAIAAADYPLARRMLAELLAGQPTARVYLAAADLATAEHGDGGETREMLARAARAERDPAWCADGLVSQHWLPVSPMSGRIDAFVWTTPPTPLSEMRKSMQETLPAPEMRPAPEADPAQEMRPAPSPSASRTQADVMANAPAPAPGRIIDITPPAPAASAKPKAEADTGHSSRADANGQPGSHVLPGSQASQDAKAPQDLKTPQDLQAQQGVNGQPESKLPQDAKAQVSTPERVTTSPAPAAAPSAKPGPDTPVPMAPLHPAPVSDRATIRPRMISGDSASEPSRTDAGDMSKITAGDTGRPGAARRAPIIAVPPPPDDPGPLSEQDDDIGHRFRLNR